MKTKNKTVALFFVFSGAILVSQFGWSQQQNSSHNKPDFFSSLMTGDGAAISELIKGNKTLIDKDPTSGEPPLVEAAEWSQTKMVELLVTNNADVNVHGVWGYTALHFAARSGDAKTVAFLLKHHADVNARDENGMTPICLAVRNAEVVKLLLANGADINAGGANTALSQAVEDTRYVGTNTVQLLLTNGARISGDEIYRAMLFGKPDVFALLMRYCKNSTNPADQETLHGILGKAMNQNRREMALTIISTSIQFETNVLSKMVAAGNAAAVRSILATNSGCLNNKDYLGWTALHIAALAGQDDIAEILLSNQAMPDMHDDAGNTPLHWAAFLGNEELVKMLLKHQANKDISGSSGDSPLTFALQNDFPSIAAMLITNGANPNLAGMGGQTPLQIATSKENVELMKLLIAHGASVNNCIQIAVQSNSPEAVRLLVANGADLESQMRGGETLLHLWAEGAGNTNIANQFLAAGCNLNATNGDGQTPLHLAVMKWNFHYKPDLVRTNSNPKWPSDFIVEYSGGAAAVWLLNHGAKANAKDKNGQTPLRLIVTSGNLKAIQALLDHGADVNATDNKGKTPLALFEDLKRQEYGWGHGWLMRVDVKAVENLLLKYGAKGEIFSPPTNRIPTVVFRNEKF